MSDDIFDEMINLALSEFDEKEIQQEKKERNKKIEEVFLKSTAPKKDDIPPYLFLDESADMTVSRPNGTFRSEKGKLTEYTSPEFVKYTFYENGNVKSKSYQDKYQNYDINGDIAGENFFDGSSINYEKKTFSVPHYPFPISYDITKELDDYDKNALYIALKQHSEDPDKLTVAEKKTLNFVSEDKQKGYHKQINYTLLSKNKQFQQG